MRKLPPRSRPRFTPPGSTPGSSWSPATMPKQRCRAIAERGDPLLIVGGGDGTVSAAASALAGSRHRARHPAARNAQPFRARSRHPDRSGRGGAAIARGNERRVDIAEMNGRTFINNSAVGLYPLMVIDRDAQRKRLGRSKRLAMVVAAIRTLAPVRTPAAALTVNAEQARVDTPLLFVGNNDYQLELPGAGRRDTLDDGKLCVLVMRSKSRAGLLAATARALVGRTRRNDMVRIEGVERLRVGSRRSVLAVSLDGEVCHIKPPLDYRIRKAALRVIAP